MLDTNNGIYNRRKKHDGSNEVTFWSFSQEVGDDK
jgi:hypothetical protein